MDLSNYLLIALFFFIFAAQNGNSTRCYHCDTEKSCRENPGNCTANEHSKYCWKSIWKEDGKQMVKKGCNDPVIGKPGKLNKCETVTYLGVRTTFCVCTGDFCNNSSKNNILSTSLIFSTVFLAFAKLFI